MHVKVLYLLSLFSLWKCYTITHVHTFIVKYTFSHVTNTCSLTHMQIQMDLSPLPPFPLVLPPPTPLLPLPFLPLSSPSPLYTYRHTLTPKHDTRNTIARRSYQTRQYIHNDFQFTTACTIAPPFTNTPSTNFPYHQHKHPRPQTYKHKHTHQRPAPDRHLSADDDTSR